MDRQVNLPESGSGFSVPDSVRALGLSLIAPIDTQALSEDEVELWWQFNKTQEYMFSDFERGNRIGWIARFRDMRHLHLDIGGDGYALLINAWCCDTPEIHFCIWNPLRPFSLTLQAAVEILDFTFSRLQATRITGFIPTNNKLSAKLATMLGFKFEGCIRKSFRFFDQSYDVTVHGLLKEEWKQRQERLSHAKQQHESN